MKNVLKVLQKKTNVQVIVDQNSEECLYLTYSLFQPQSSSREKIYPFTRVLILSNRREKLGDRKNKQVKVTVVISQEYIKQGLISN